MRVFTPTRSYFPARLGVSVYGLTTSVAGLGPDASTGFYEVNMHLSVISLGGEGTRCCSDCSSFSMLCVYVQ